MSLIHDIIKIKYSRLGYLPNYPYHLISDEEMFNAFIYLGEDSEDSVERFFEDYYPNPFLEKDIIYVTPSGEQISLRSEYVRLKKYIISTIRDYLSHQGTADQSNYTIPDWIYSYMLGEVVYNHPYVPDKFEYSDMLDLLKLFNIDNVSNEMTPEICKMCYEESTKYISTLTSGVRPPTVFGEPHVIRQLRLES